MTRLKNPNRSQNRDVYYTHSDWIHSFLLLVSSRTLLHTFLNMKWMDVDNKYKKKLCIWTKICNCVREFLFYFITLCWLCFFFCYCSYFMVQVPVVPVYTIVCLYNKCKNALLIHMHQIREETLKSCIHNIRTVSLAAQNILWTHSS